MPTAIRPHTKLAAALLTAGVVAAGPAMVGSAPETTLALSNIAVRPASFVTDALWAAGDVVSAVADTVMIGTDLALGLNYYWDDSDYGWGVPTNPLSFVVAASQDLGSALSWLAQTYLNPSDNYANYAYPWYFKTAVVEPLVKLLPAPLSSTVMDAINGIANSIDGALSALPDATPAVDSLWNQYNTTAGRALYAVQSTIALPVTLLSAVTFYLAYLPGNLEATVESAIAHPTDIPGLLSNLVYDALDPTLYNGLLGNLSYNLLKPAFFLPAPIGESSFGAKDGLAYGLYQGIANAVSSVLNLLPAPITPTPFSAAAASAAASPVAVNGNHATVSEMSSADETDGTKTDGAASDDQTAEPPRAHAQVRPSRTAISPHHKSAKPSQAGKSDGGSTGGQGRSARAGKAGGAA